jgi:hypothetical protein
MIDKAIYSFWSKPMNDKYVGFSSEKSLIECISISVMMSRKHFSKVELITDIKGKELLIDKYNIPFTSVSTELEEALVDINQKHWSIGKIYACKIQKEPFIHIDNDVIWFKKPPIELLTADACFQNVEVLSYSSILSNSYDFLIDHLKSNHNYPDYIETNDDPLNCGIIGFNRLEHLETWWQDSLKYIDYVDSYFQEEYYKELPHLVPCLIFEQYYIGGICKNFNYDVKFVARGHEENWGVNDSTSILLGYTHLIAHTKRLEYVEQLLSSNYEILFNELNQIEN